MQKPDLAKILVSEKSIPEYVRSLKEKELKRKAQRRRQSREPLLSAGEIAKRKGRKAMTKEERVAGLDFKGIEKETLEKVFRLFDQGNRQSFGWRDIKRVMVHYGVTPRQDEA
jgi:hypothetical protein